MTTQYCNRPQSIQLIISHQLISINILTTYIRTDTNQTVLYSAACDLANVLANSWNSFLSLKFSFDSFFFFLWKTCDYLLWTALELMEWARNMSWDLVIPYTLSLYNVNVHISYLPSSLLYISHLPVTHHNYNVRIPHHSSTFSRDLRHVAQSIVDSRSTKPRKYKW